VPTFTNQNTYGNMGDHRLQQQDSSVAVAYPRFVTGKIIEVACSPDEFAATNISQIG
jgi:hypothetical protein